MPTEPLPDRERLLSAEIAVRNCGELVSWRVLYRMAAADARLRRIKRTVLTVPVVLPRLWLAALASLGEAIDLGAEVPDYYDSTAV